MHGVFTNDFVTRVGKINAYLSTLLDEIFLPNRGQQKHVQRMVNYQKEVASFVTNYKDDTLFDYNPGREHESFPLFMYNTSIKKPAELKARLLSYNMRLDSSLTCNVQQDI